MHTLSLSLGPAQYLHAVGGAAASHVSQQPAFVVLLLLFGVLWIGIAATAQAFAATIAALRLAFEIVSSFLLIALMAGLMVVLVVMH